MILKRSLVITLGLFIAMFIVACGGNTTTGGGPYGSGSTTPPATTTPTTGGNGSSAVVQTATVTVKGQSEMVLTDAQRKTLYYFTADSATQSACSSSCAQMWPPLLFAGSGAPGSSTALARWAAPRWWRISLRGIREDAPPGLRRSRTAAGRTTW